MAHDPLGLVGQTVESFHILRLVGEGAFSLVYEARGRDGDGRVALKVIRPESARRPEVLRRFRREIAFLKTFRHPSVARIFGEGEILGLPYIEMEFVEGESLAERLTRGPLGVEDALAIAIDVAAALDHAHTQAGVIHRDVKPSNIRIDEAGCPRLMDYGVAKACDGTVGDPDDTRIGEFLGTLAYAAPEQIRGEEIDGRADVYALGMVLQEMLTGKPPSRKRQNGPGEGPETASEPERAHPQGLLIPSRIDQAISWFTDSDPQRRCPSARVARLELESTRAGQPSIREASDRPTEIAQTAAGSGGGVRRRTKLAGILLAIAALGIAGLLGLTSLDRRFRIITFPAVPDYLGALIGDMDGDGKPDLLVPRGPDVLVCGWRGEVRWIFPFGRTIGICLLTDIHDDGEPELFAVTRDDKEAILIASDRPGFPVRDYRVQARRDTSIVAVAAADLESDGSPELVCCLRTGKKEGNQPRGVWVFDARTGEERWSFPIAPFVNHETLELVDLDGDRHLEIVFGTYAPGNGASGPDGSDDAHCYAYALRSTGELLWRTEIAGTYQGVETTCADMDGDGTPEVLATVYCDEVPYETPPGGQVVILTARGEKRETLLEGDSCRGPRVYRGADRSPVFYTASSDGRICRLSPGEKLLVSKPLPYLEGKDARISCEHVSDLDADGAEELVLLSYVRHIRSREDPRDVSISDVRVHVLGSDLSERWSRSILSQSIERDFRTWCEDVEGDARKEIIVCADKVYVLRDR